MTMPVSLASPLVIQRQVLQIHVNGAETDGFAVQRIVAGLCQNELTPVIERVLRRFDPSDERLVIERLDIDAGDITLEQLERDLPGRIAAELGRALSAVTAPHRASSESVRATLQRHRRQTPPDTAGQPHQLIEREPSTHAGEPTRQDTPDNDWLGIEADGWALDIFDSPDLPETTEQLDSASSRAAFDSSGHVLPGSAARGLGPPLQSEARANVSYVSELQHITTALAFFLGGGNLPWSFQLPEGQSLEQVILAVWRDVNGDTAAGAGEQRAILRALNSANARRRLTIQFTRDFLQTLLARLAPEAVRVMAEIIPVLQRASREEAGAFTFERQVWESVFAKVVTRADVTAAALLRTAWGNSPMSLERRTALASILRRQWPDVFPDIEALPPPPKGRTPKQTSTAPPGALTQENKPGTVWIGLETAANVPTLPRTYPPIDIENGLYLNLAGLVLLHPFLPQFFTALGIAIEDTLAQPERALHVLYYLATGRQGAPEYELALPKVLCGWPLDAPVDASVELTSAEMDEAAGLLSAVIHHWDSLRDTSPDGLRGSFLVRPGKLSERNGEWLLQVETSGYDFLLDQLPWNLSMIQLPWMQRMLWVEWR